MTQTEQAAYIFIRDFIVSHGYAPSYREIATGIGNKSSSGIGTILRSLQEQGKVDFVDGINRTITLPQRERTLAALIDAARDVYDGGGLNDDGLDELGRLLDLFDQETDSTGSPHRVEAVPASH